MAVPYYVSKKIPALSFLLTGMIVFIHGFNVNISLPHAGASTGYTVIRFFEFFVSDGICRSAVPLFFAISGYLATSSLDVKQGAMQQYLTLLKKRFFSLLLPYLLVSGLGIGLVVLLQLFPFSRSYFNNYNVETTSWSKWLQVWLISPVPFQLWFVRFLMLYFILFPLVFGLVKYFGLAFVLVLGYLWSDFFAQNWLGISKMEVEGLFFFSLGMLFALNLPQVFFRVGKSFLFFLVAVWLAWIAYRTYLIIQPHKDHFAVHYHLIGYTFLGTFVLWVLYDRFHHQIENNTWIKQGAAYGFGVFLFHEPLLTILKKIIIRFMPGVELGLLVSYLVAPVLSFLIALWFSKWLHTTLPALYGVLTGFRKPRQPLRENWA